MTPPQKRAVVTGIVTLVLGTVILAAARQVVLRPEYDIHVQSVNEELGDIKYLICLDHRTDSRCR